MLHLWHKEIHSGHHHLQDEKLGGGVLLEPAHRGGGAGISPRLIPKNGEFP